VLVVPIMRGITPYGFIGKYQGFNAVGKTVPQVAEELFRILVSSPKTRSRMLTCLADAILQSGSEDEAMDMLGVFDSIGDLPVGHLERIREGAILARRGLATISLTSSVEPEVVPDEEIPF
jgi:hypothetical protein